MLKKVLFGGLLLAAATPAFAQRQCATPMVEDLPLTEQAILNRIERQTERYQEEQVSKGATANRTTAIVTIPVVVHVLYNTAAQNISTSVIQSQITVLNNDFAKLNSDFNQNPAAFQPLAADMEVRFALATRDPNGNPTTGIIRKSTTKTYFQYGGADRNGVFVKQSSKGGDDAWNTSKYLNIWVCNFGGTSAGLLGYATFPSDAGTYKDGVVIGYQYFGVNPSLGGVYGYGRTATHEIGHWLNLRHIWGDASCGNDLVSDTPTQQTSNGGCPAFPHRTCGNTTNGDMFVNYMDYTNDQCMHMFTSGQKARAQALFAAGGARVSLLTSTGLSVPVAPGGTGVTAALRTVDVYPNPATEAAAVRLDMERSASKLVVRVLNLQGQPVFERALGQLPAGSSEVALPRLGRGIYSVQVLGDGPVRTTRLAVTE